MKLDKRLLDTTSLRVSIIEILDNRSNLLKLDTKELKELKTNLIADSLGKNCVVFKERVKYIKNLLGVKSYNIIIDFLDSIKFIYTPYKMENGMYSQTISWEFK